MTKSTTTNQITTLTTTPNHGMMTTNTTTPNHGRKTTTGTMTGKQANFHATQPTGTTPMHAVTQKMPGSKDGQNKELLHLPAHHIQIKSNQLQLLANQ